MTAATPWWTTFFTGTAVTFWHQIQTEEQIRAETDFAARALALEPGQRVLDVPCGHGRIALELAARGHAVTGVDLSLEALALGREDAARRDLAVALEHRDMRDLPWRDAFDAAVCIGNSFGYMDDEGNRDFLAAVQSALRRGGRLLLHAHGVHEVALANLQQRVWYPAGDLLFLIERRYDPVQSLMHTRYTFVKDGTVDPRDACYRIYSMRELHELLASVGLRVTKSLGSHAGEPFQLGAATHYLVAEKV